MKVEDIWKNVPVELGRRTEANRSKLQSLIHHRQILNDNMVRQRNKLLQKGIAFRRKDPLYSSPDPNINLPNFVGTDTFVKNIPGNKPILDWFTKTKYRIDRLRDEIENFEGILP